MWFICLGGVISEVIFVVVGVAPSFSSPDTDSVQSICQYLISPHLKSVYFTAVVRC